MKTLKTLILAFLVALVLAPSALAQTDTVHTTLTTTIATGNPANTETIVVGSTTGMSASTASAQYFVLIEHELMRITAVPSATTLTVRRAQGGVPTPHTSGVVVIYGPGGGNFSNTTGNTRGVFLNTRPVGRCTASGNQYLPVVALNVGNVYALYNCNNSTWVEQTLPDDIAPTYTRYCSPGFIGALTLLTSFGDLAGLSPITMGNNITPVAGSVYYGTIEIPRTMRVTGLSMLNGTVAGTDDLIYALYRADGVRIAVTDTAGTVASGVGRFQDIAFTAVELVTGPARYWIAWQAEGTTTRFRGVGLTPGVTTAGLGGWIGMLGSSFTGTFATLPSLTASTAGSSPGTSALPTTLISNVAPVGCAY